MSNCKKQTIEQQAMTDQDPIQSLSFNLKVKLVRKAGHMLSIKIFSGVTLWPKMFRDQNNSLIKEC